MDFRILGPLEVYDGDRPLRLAGARQRALLALLLLHANEVVSRDRLIDELWGADGGRDASKALQVAVSRLRRALGCDSGADQVLITRRPGYELRVEPGGLDLERFERLSDEGRAALEAGDARLASALLRQALELWRGPPLADIAYESFAQAEIQRVEELRMRTLEDRLGADLELARHEEVIAELHSLVALHPLRERLRARLILALYRAGRQAEALEAYRDGRRTLVEELGIEPGRELHALEEAILRQDPELDLATAAQPAAPRPSTPFVGREGELAQLEAGLDDAFAGGGRLFLIAGEPGIGKSRLAEELITRARARGARVLVGRCWEAGGAPAYWPWVQSLRAHVRETDSPTLRSQLGAGAPELAQIVPELRRSLPDLPEPPPLDSEVARFRLFDATADFLRSASEQRPIVLVLDDLHAADAPSLLLLRFLARELGSTRVLLVGAFRDVDPLPGEPLTEMLVDVAREPITRRLTLEGLSEGEVAKYVEAAGSQATAPGLVAALHEETEGNPLFVGEIVRLLSIEGAPSESGAERRFAIPESIRDVIGRRLFHLSEECRRMLPPAAVLGREFSSEALGRMSDVPVDELLDTLEEASAARVVSDVPGGPGRLRFAHVLIRDTLYQGLPATRRVQLHRLAVQALEELYGGEPGPHLAELAHHSIAGSDFEKGLGYARRAGDRAQALLAYEEAARLYESALRALELCDPGEEQTRCGLLLSLGEAKARAGNTPAAKQIFLDAAGIARRLGLPHELGRAAVGYGGRFMWARAAGDDRLVPLLEEGLAALADEEVELRARLLARLAGVLRDEHSRDRRDALSREAVELARRTGNPAALAFALDGRAAAITGPDTVAECLATATELREVAERIGDTERVANSMDYRRTSLVISGDLRGAEHALATESQIADDLGQPSQLWQVYSARAMLALATGKLSEAEELIPKALAFGERAMPPVAIPVYRLQRHALADFQGRLEHVVPEMRDLVAEYPTRPAFRCALAYLHARLGWTREARQEFDDFARDDFSALPFDQEWLYGMSLLAETSTLLGDIRSAGVLFELLTP